jgi:carboxymethylenebutenolidase
VVALGFCFGGRTAFMSAQPRFGLAGVIGLYGYPDVLFGAPGPTQMAAELRGPILALFGGADEAITPEAVAAFGAALEGAGAEHEIVTYPGAPHSFFELGRPDLAEASADAWSRILGFMGDVAVRGAA